MQLSTSTPPKIAYSIREAVAATSFSKTTLYAMIASGALHAVRIGGRTVIPASSLHALIHGEG